MGASATVSADFIDGIIYSLSVSCQSCVMSATKPSEVDSEIAHSSAVSEWYILGGGVPNIVLGPSFCMAKFVKCVWMCELDCWGWC